jgi:hypothetical protein
MQEGVEGPKPSQIEQVGTSAQQDTKQNPIFTDGEETIAQGFIRKPEIPLEQKCHLHILNATESLTPIAPVLETVTKDSIARISELIPVKNINVAVFDDPSSIIPHFGFGGSARTPSLS